MVEQMTIHARTPLRERIAMIMVNAMKPVYFYMRRHRKAWTVTQDELCRMPAGTLGRDLGNFLTANGLMLMPKAEFHDVYHVLFRFGTTMPEETAIQFVSLGNGRYTLPHIVTNIVSLVFYPQHWDKYLQAYRTGRAASKFHHLDFEPMLRLQTSEVRDMIGV